MPQPPDRLYKYRSLQGDSLQYTHDIFVNNRLYWPAPREFNDPFDCAPVAVFQGSKLKKSAYAKRIFRERMPNASKSEVRNFEQRVLRQTPEETANSLTNIAQGIRNDVGICSLTEKRDNILMWAHYADAHGGICLEFEVEKTPVDRASFLLAFPVKYSAARPEVNVLAKDPDMLFEQSLLTKADFWSYEAEWRLINQHAGSGLYKFPPRRLSGVVLGAAISDKNHALVRSWIGDYKFPIKLYNAQLDGSRFRLSIQEVEE